MSIKNKKPNVLVVSSYSTSYVLRDIELIKRFYRTKAIVGNNIPKNAINVFHVMIKIVKGVFWSDVSFIWFADFRALITIFFAKLLMKKTILVMGGYEVAHVPEISYGGSIRKNLKRKINWIIHRADVVLSVSKASRDELIRHYNFETSKLVYNGVETEKFYRNYLIKKENIAITVGAVTISNLTRKGIETFVKAAAHLPEIPFYVIGKCDEDALASLNKNATENVVFTGFVTEKELIIYYQRAQVYVQVSAHEGFGISLAEAMLCKCIPVATNRGALPEVVGKTGFYVPFNDPKETAKAIRKAIVSDKGSEARNHILENFSMRRREEALINIIQDILCK